MLEKIIISFALLPKYLIQQAVLHLGTREDLVHLVFFTVLLLDSDTREWDLRNLHGAHQVGNLRLRIQTKVSLEQEQQINNQ